MWCAATGNLVLLNAGAATAAPGCSSAAAQGTQTILDSGSTLQRLLCNCAVLALPLLPPRLLHMPASIGGDSSWIAVLQCQACYQSLESMQDGSLDGKQWAKVSHM